MNPEHVKRLKALVSRATRGEWKSRGKIIWSVYDEFPGEQLVGEAYGEIDAAYIAAASPDAVTELIGQMERFDREANWLAEQLGAMGAECPNASAMVEYPCEGSCNDFCRLLAWRDTARRACNGTLFY